jgi:hypothetical protein
MLEGQRGWIVATYFIWAVACPAAWAYDPLPLPAGKEAYTQARYNEDYHAYVEREFEEYSKKTKDPAALRDEALAYLREVNKILPNLGTTAADVAPRFADPLIKQGASLLERGSVDPLVRLAYNRIAFRHTKEYPKWKKLLGEVLVNLRDVDYSTQVRMTILTRHYAAYMRTENSASKSYKPADLQPVIQALDAWLKAEAENVKVQRIVWQLFNDFQVHVNYKERQKFLDELARLDHGHAWFKTMVAANQSWLNADKFRLRDRNEEEVATYHAALAEAASLYRGAWQAAPQFPEPCVQLLFIARQGVIPEDPREWFDRAVAAQLDYGPAYTHYRMVLRKPEEQAFARLFAFGQECAATGRYDTAVAFELTEALFAAEQVLGHEANVYREAGVYQALTKLLDGAAQAPIYNGAKSNHETQQWIAAIRTAIALRVGKSEDAQKHYPLGSESVPHLARALKMFGVDEDVNQVRFGIETLKAGIDIGALDRKFNQLSTIAECQKASQELAEMRKDKQPAVRGWIDGWIMRLDAAAKLIAGESYTLEFTPEWVQNIGGEHWEFVDKHTVRARGGRDLVLPYPPSLSAYELSCQITATSEAEGHKLHGFVIAASAKRTMMYPIALQLEKKQLAIQSPHPFADIDVPVEKENALQVRVWPYYADVVVNRERIYSNSMVDFEPQARVLLIGPQILNKQANDVTIRNVSIRMLTNQPPYRESPARIEFFTAELDKQPDLGTQYMRGVDYFKVKQYDKCIEDMNAVLKARPERWIALLFRASAQRKLGLYQAAFDDYEKVRKCPINDRNVDFQRAWLYATCKDDKLRDLKKAAEINKAILNDRNHKTDGQMIAVAIHLHKKEFDQAGKLLAEIKPKAENLEDGPRTRFEQLEAAHAKQQAYLE